MLVYADDLVLLAHTKAAMRRMLALYVILMHVNMHEVSMQERQSGCCLDKMISLSVTDLLI